MGINENFPGGSSTGDCEKSSENEEENEILLKKLIFIIDIEVLLNGIKMLTNKAKNKIEYLNLYK